MAITWSLWSPPTLTAMAGSNTPPGMYHGASTHATADRFTMDGGFLANFTCAGSAGCHGIRNQAIIGSTLNDNTTSTCSGNSLPVRMARTTMISIAASDRYPALSGAHHNSYDGVKTPATDRTTADVDGQYIADSYRFIPGLIGAGNTTADSDRWQNASSDQPQRVLWCSWRRTGYRSCGNCHAGDGTNRLRAIFTPTAS